VDYFTQAGRPRFAVPQAPPRQRRKQSAVSPFPLLLLPFDSALFALSQSPWRGEQRIGGLLLVPQPVGHILGVGENDRSND